MASSTKRVNSEPIRAFVRLRPLSKEEVETGSTDCIDILNSKEIAIRQQHDKHYSFDEVFASDVSQSDVFCKVVRPLIPSVLAGYNCTVVAYGHTGTGKTYTIAGGPDFKAITSLKDNLQAAIIPRALMHLFALSLMPGKKYTFRVSYFQLHNEEFFDLLSDVEGKCIRLFEDRNQKGSLIISGIAKETVHNIQEAYEIFQRGQERRHSSCSHTVFSITIHAYRTTLEGEEIIRTGNLNFVDLAGSENISKFGAVDIHGFESVNINHSLLTLERVIKALDERSVYIPYSESKLTTMLQDSLGGRTKTSIIATISPATSCVEETLNTLDYAHSARNIINWPEVNEHVVKKYWRTACEIEIERLRKALQAASAGATLHEEKHVSKIHENELLKEELAAKDNVIRALEQQLKSTEKEKKLQLDKMKQGLKCITLSRNKFRKYQKKLRKIITQKHTQKNLATYYKTKAKTLHGEVKLLSETKKQVGMSFRKKVVNLCSVSKENNDSMKKVSQEVIQKCKEITNELINFMISIKDSSEQASNLVKTVEEQHIKNYHAYQKYQQKVSEEGNKFVTVAYSDLKTACQIEINQEGMLLDNILRKVDDIREASEWIGKSTALNNIIDDIISNLDLSRTAQVLIEKEIENEIKDIGEMHRTISDRLQNLEGKISQSRNLNRQCYINVTKTGVSINSRLAAVKIVLKSSVSDISTSLIEAADIIKDHKSRESAVKEVLKQLEISKNKFKKIEPVSKHTMEVYAQNLNHLASNHMKTTQEYFRGISSNNQLVLRELSQLKETISKMEITTTTELKEYQENLTNFINNALIDVDPGEGTSCPIQTPREQILMGMRDCFKELSLGKSLEDVSARDSLEEDASIPSAQQPVFMHVNK